MGNEDSRGTRWKGFDEEAFLRELERVEETRKPAPSIFRAPPPLRNLRPQAFSPQMVVIGPYHRSPVWSSDYEPMEKLKKSAIDALLRDLLPARGGGSGGSITTASSTDRALEPALARRGFHRIVRRIARSDARVRPHYELDEMAQFNEVQLAQILALDAAFVLSVLTCPGIGPLATKVTTSYKISQVHRSAFSRPVLKAVVHDLFLVENQIPLFLLTKILRWIVQADKSRTTFTKSKQLFIEEDDDEEEETEEDEDEITAIKWLESRVPFAAAHVLPFARNPGVMRQAITGIAGRGRATPHLLHCLYSIVTTGGTSKGGLALEATVNKPVAVPNATRLHNAGVRFSGHEMSLREISFQRGILSLPCVHIDDGTERIFRNLVTYESQLDSDRTDVLSYLHFMNCLINTPEDVALLLEQGIITETIGSNHHVAKVWNSLTTNTVWVFSTRYNDVAIDLDKYCKAKFHGLATEFYRKYLSKPWLVISLLSAMALLILTFLILWYTILLYKLESE